MTDPARPVQLFDLDEFIEKHVIRRDGWCQECGRWPAVKGDPCPVAAALAAEKAAHEETRRELERTEAATNALCDSADEVRHQHTALRIERDRLRDALEKFVNCHAHSCPRCTPGAIAVLAALATTPSTEEP